MHRNSKHDNNIILSVSINVRFLLKDLRKWSIFNLLMTLNTFDTSMTSTTLMFFMTWIILSKNPSRSLILSLFIAYFYKTLYLCCFQFVEVHTTYMVWSPNHEKTRPETSVQVLVGSNILCLGVFRVRYPMSLDFQGT